jgi:CubicO group peptidase (beta-lactamase class C family)
MKKLTLIFILLQLFCGCSKNSSQKSDNYIQEVSPIELGADTLILNKMSTKISEQVYPNIHSLLIAKNGKLFYEKYFNGKDQNWGSDLGVVVYNDTTLHDLRSITKSIISACIGIAIQEGLINNVDEKVSKFFPEYTFTDKKKDWTIEHFLTMTTGLSWNENLPYNNPKNDEIKMVYSDDPVKYVLDKPLENVPGTRFNYNGGATQVLSEIVERVSGSDIGQFADKYLFKPLGIKKFEWNHYSRWNQSISKDKFGAASGLRLTSKDLLKFALLYRNKGIWNGKQILPDEWVKESFSKKIEFPSAVAEGNDAYGYQFWIWSDSTKNRKFNIVSAIGNGDQHIYWDIDNDLIVISTAGNYNQWGIKNDSYALLKDYIYRLFD